MIKKMFRCLLYLALLQSCAGSNNVPVLLIDHDNVMSHINVDPNPFQTLTADFFTGVIADATSRAECVIVFAEETLCTEDISVKDKLGTPYHHLHEGILDKKALYMPSVSEPYRLLCEVLKPQQFNSFHLGYGDKLQLSDQVFKHLYIYFENNPNLTRPEVLRTHDMIVKEVYFIVKQLKAGPVVAFYTGKENPVKAQQLRYLPRADIETPKERGVMIVTKDALFRLNGVFSSMQTSARRSGFDQTPEVEFERRTRNTLNTTMQYSDFHLQFNFEFEEKEWKLANVALLEAGDEVGRTETFVSAPWERSYYCADPITIFNKRDGSFITLSEYQIEPLSEARRAALVRRRNDESFKRYKRGDADAENNGDAGGGDKDGGGQDAGVQDAGVQDAGGQDAGVQDAGVQDAGGQNAGSQNAGGDGGAGETTGETPIPFEQCSFSRHVSCGPYFNVAILAALFIFLMFMVICMWGVLMLFNCGTNSRFDDPNQKPLVIAQEVGQR